MVYTELTTTIGSPWTTGVQRVVREIIPRLMADDRFDIRPVVWCYGCRDFRSITNDEIDLLRHPKLGPSQSPTNGTIKQRFVKAAKKYISPMIPQACKQGARRIIFRFTQADTHAAANHHLTPVSSWESGATFFEIEAGWQCPTPRPQLFKCLTARDITIMAIVNDVMPITNPEWFEKRLATQFTTWFDAVKLYASTIVAISEFTRNEVVKLGATQQVAVVTYGADFPAATYKKNDAAFALPAEPYVLCVGTLEPRKNHAVLLDAFDSLRNAYPTLSLVLVGRRGWQTDALVKRLRNHPEFGHRLLWIDTATDSQLDRLYRHCSVVAVPSICEGLGLPVIEALMRGAPVVSSPGGALLEAGGDLVTYVDPLDAAQWSLAISQAVVSPSPTVGDGAEMYVGPTWANTAEQISGLVRNG